MLMHVLGTQSGVAFNLAVALIFSLTVVSSSGLFLNMITSVRKNQTGMQDGFHLRKKLMVFSLLAPLFILLISNGAGLLEVLHSKGVFWEFPEDGQAQSAFWKWLDIQELVDAPSEPFDWTPSRAGGTWWWRASRVLQDYTLDGQSREIIDEFPFFSFLLADLHPHLISLPFVMMNIYLGFYLFSQSESRSFITTKLKERIRQPFIWLAGLMVGSLIFINTWDFPIYFIFICLCLFVPAFQEESDLLRAFKNNAGNFVFLAALCVLFYIPFLLGLSSQASGFIPSLIFRTRGIHYFIMFLPQLILLVVFLLIIVKSLPRGSFLKSFVFISLGLIMVFFISVIYVLLLERVPQLFLRMAETFNLASISQRLVMNPPILNLLRIFGAQNTGDLISDTFDRIIKDPWVFLSQAFLIAVSWTTISVKKIRNDGDHSIAQPITSQFVFILLFLAAALTIFPEFFYLKDQFGWRMNTIFKIYYQIWVLLSIISAYSISLICQIRKVTLRRAAVLLSGITITIGLIYPVFAIKDKTNSFRNMELSLDGNQYFADSQPAEFEAIQFLTTAPYGVVAEAVGGSYSNYARISRMTGYPAVLGWPGHEVQWRGGMNELGGREADMQRLFSTMDWEEAESIMKDYDIRYVLIGDLENRTYTVYEDKFRLNMVPVFNQQGVTIYSFNKK
jgi:YYY domain-containing protein